jgi:hypothetical protein
LLARENESRRRCLNPAAAFPPPAFLYGIMPKPADRDELILLLARVFDRAWNRYYQRRPSNAISEEVASDSLARHLVALLKEGVKDEGGLAERGLQHLISLTPPP